MTNTTTIEEPSAGGLVWKDQGGHLVTRVGPFTLSAGRSLETFGRNPDRMFDAYVWRHGITIETSCEHESIEIAQASIVRKLLQYVATERGMFVIVERMLGAHVA